MASSEKPDFIDSKEKEAPVKLTTGGLSGAEDLPTSESSDGAPSPLPFSELAPSASSPSNLAFAPDATPASTPISGLRPSVENDDVATLRRQTPRGNSMRKLPGGSTVFIGLLAVVCMFGNQIDEMRNRTLVDLAKGLGVGSRGYVETVGDLGESLHRHNNNNGAKAAYEKALFELQASDKDVGTRGAFIRLKLAEIAFDNGYVESGLGRKKSISPDEKKKHFDRAYEYKAEAEALSSKALEMLRISPRRWPPELPFLLFAVADEFADWSDYARAILLNEKALDLWERGSPNRRSNVNAALGFQYIMTGNLTKAEECLKNSLNWSMRDGVTGYNAWRSSLLGRAQVGLNKYMEAEVNLSRAEEMLETLKGKHMDVELARVYTDQGRVKAAKGITVEALKLFQKSEGILKKHRSRVFDAMRNHLYMANLYRDMGQTAKANELYADIISKIDSGDEGPDRKEVMKEWDLSRALMGGR